MIDAIYFDGQTTRPHRVNLLLHKGIVAIQGDGIRRSVRLSKLIVSEKLTHAPRLLRFMDGSFVEVIHPSLDKLLRKNGYRDPWVVRWQQNWPLSLFALIVVLATLIAGYQWGLPAAADKLAQHFPVSIEKRIGDAGLKLVDKNYMRPSQLTIAEQERMRRLFAGLKPPDGIKTQYRLEFRESRIGPNAFALPNGVIVLTDQLVLLAHDDQAVLAVLAHELGHLHRRHSLRRLLQALGIGIVVNLFVGDVSSALVAAPTFLLDQKYSRDFEREADQYAIGMMRENGLPLSPMANLFEKMRDAPADMHVASAGDAADNNDEDDGDDGEGDGDEGTNAPQRSTAKTAQIPQNKKTRRKPLDYFSSHPSDAERIATLRAADTR